MCVCRLNPLAAAPASAGVKVLKMGSGVGQRAEKGNDEETRNGEKRNECDTVKMESEYSRKGR